MREARLVTLTGRLGSDHHLDAIGTDDEIGALLGRTGRRLDIVDEAQAEQLAAAARIVSALLDAREIGEPEQAVHVVFRYWQ